MDRLPVPCRLSEFPVIAARSLGSPDATSFLAVLSSGPSEAWGLAVASLLEEHCQMVKGGLVLHLEPSSSECWKPLLKMCQSISHGVFLELASRPAWAHMDMDGIGWWKRKYRWHFDRLCCLSAAVSQEKSWRGAVPFAIFLSRVCTQLKFLLLDVFSVAALVNLYESPMMSRCVQHPSQITEGIYIPQLQTVSLLVPLDRALRVAATNLIPDVAATVHGLFAKARVAVSNATLVVWACYLKDLDRPVEDLETAACSQLKPVVGRLRELFQVSESGESGGLPFRGVELRACPYKPWRGGEGIEEVPSEVLEEVAARMDEQGTSNSAARTSGVRTVKDSRSPQPPPAMEATS